MYFLKYKKNNVWDMTEGKYVGPDYEYFDRGQVHTKTALKLWKEQRDKFDLPNYFQDVKILEAYEKVSDITKNVPDEFYYGTNMKFAPKFVTDYVMSNWEYKTNELGYEVWHELDVNGFTVKIKDGEFPMGIVFIRYGSVTIPMFWKDVFKDGE